MTDFDLDLLRQLLPFLIPLVLIELALMVAALVDLIRGERTRGPKALWAVIIIFVQVIGPILYFILGREEE